MKVKIPVTNSIIGKLNGASVEEVHTVTNVGHLSPAKLVKENPGFTVIKQSKSHAVANIPDEIIAQYAVFEKVENIPDEIIARYAVSEKTAE